MLSMELDRRWRRNSLFFVLLRLEARPDPGFALDAVGRVHLVGGIAFNIDDLQLTAFDLGRADRRVHDRLMPLAERHLYRSTATFECQVLLGGDGALLINHVAAFRLLVSGFHAQDRLRHLEGRVVRRHLVALLIARLQPTGEFALRRKRAERPARTQDGSVGNARAEPIDGGLASREDHLVLFEQSARCTLQDETLKVAAPHAGVDDLGAAAEERSYLGAELAGQQFRHLRRLHFDVGLQGLHGALEVGPGILAPRVVLIDACNRFYVGMALDEVKRDGHIIHCARGTGTEDILVAGVLEDPWRTAVEEDRELLQLFGNRRDCEAVAARYVPDDQIDPGHEIAKLGNLLLRPAGLVDDHEFDGRAGEALLGVGCWHAARIEELRHQLRRVACRNTEGTGRGPGQQRDDADLDRLLRPCRRYGQQRQENGQRGSQAEAGR